MVVDMFLASWAFHPKRKGEYITQHHGLGQIPFWQFRMVETVKKGAGGFPGEGSGVRDSEGQDLRTLRKVMPGAQF